MKYLLIFVLCCVCLPGLAGCGGGEDRVALARQTVLTYWTDIGHGKVKTAYHMNTAGNRDVMSYQQFQQNIFSFLTSVNAIYPKVGAATVQDDRATVSISLLSPKGVLAKGAWQHLFWENGSWKIADQNGGVSQTK